MAGGATFAVPAVSLSGDVGAGLLPGSHKHLVWNAGADWDGQFSAQVKFRVSATDSAVPAPRTMPLLEMAESGNLPA